MHEFGTARLSRSWSDELSSGFLATRSELFDDFVSVERLAPPAVVLSHPRLGFRQPGCINLGTSWTNRCQNSLNEFDPFDWRQTHSFSAEIFHTLVHVRTCQ
jgi:hypothetical protein